MANKVVSVFLVVLFIQIVVIGIYLATKGNLPFFITSSPGSILDFNANKYRGDNESYKRSNVFQQINDRQAWIYSAFYDHVAAQGGRPLVRVFGLAKKDTILAVSCNFYSEGANLTSTGAIKILPGHHDADYLPSYLECHLLPSDARPTHVSVSFHANQEPTNRLQILYPGPRIRNFTVCYSVLHSNFSLAVQLIENIEMNRILGAEHFMVYNYSISPAVGHIFRRYQEDGLVTVLPWPVPTLGSHYFSQMAALNDCSYRNRNTSRFVVVVDTDELIVPRSQTTWMELIHRVSPQETDVLSFMNLSKPSTPGQTLTGCFMARSCFFYDNSTPNWDSLSPNVSFSDEEKQNIVKQKMLTLSHFRRQVHLFPYAERSKYIARPELVYISGVHEVHQFIKPMSCLHISDTAALVHHYRGPNFPAQIVNDTTLLKFKHSLYPRIMKQLQRFPEIFFSPRDAYKNTTNILNSVPVK